MSLDTQASVGIPEILQATLDTGGLSSRRARIEPQCGEISTLPLQTGKTYSTRSRRGSRLVRTQCRGVPNGNGGLNATLWAMHTPPLSPRASTAQNPCPTPPHPCTPRSQKFPRLYNRELICSGKGDKYLSCHPCNDYFRC